MRKKNNLKTGKKTIPLLLLTIEKKHDCANKMIHQLKTEPPTHNSEIEVKRKNVQNLVKL